LLCRSDTSIDTMGSDHFPVCTTIGDNFYVKNVFLYKLKISNNDLDLLYHSLCNSIDNFKNLNSDISDNPPLAYSHLESHIKNHLYSFFPPGSRHPRSRSLRQKPPSPPWWNEKCQLAINERKESARRYLAHPSSTNFLAYKRIKSKCSKILKKQKKLGWKKYCTQFDHKTPTSEIWLLIKSFKKRKLVKSTSPLDSHFQSQLINNTIDKLCPPSNLHLLWNSLNLMKERDTQLLNINLELDKSFTINELNIAINKMKLGSAPGIDQIDNRVISALPHEYRIHLLNIFNDIFKIKGTFPEQWKQSLIVLIPKSDVNSFRPISLLSCLIKTMEKMLYHRIQWH